MRKIIITIILAAYLMSFFQCESVLSYNVDNDMIDELSALEIIHGDADGMRLDETLTRVEACVLFVNTTVYKNRIDDYEFKHLKYFLDGCIDLYRDAWYNPYLWCTYSCNAWQYIFGKSDYIMSDNLVSMDEFIKVMACIAGNGPMCYENIKSVYCEGAGDGLISRENAFELIWELLDNPVFNFSTESNIADGTNNIKSNYFKNIINTDGNASNYITVLNQIGYYRAYCKVQAIDDYTAILRVEESRNFDDKAYGSDYLEPIEVKVNITENFNFSKNDKIRATIEKTDDEAEPYKVIFAKLIQ